MADRVLRTRCTKGSARYVTVLEDPGKILEQATGQRVRTAEITLGHQGGPGQPVAQHPGACRPHCLACAPHTRRPWLWPISQGGGVLVGRAGPLSGCLSLPDSARLRCPVSGARVDEPVRERNSSQDSQWHVPPPLRGQPSGDQASRVSAQGRQAGGQQHGHPGHPAPCLAVPA